jgi:hypothetical protein
VLFGEDARIFDATTFHMTGEREVTVKTAR